MSYTVLVLHAIDDFESERDTSVAHVTALEKYTSGNDFVYHHIKDDITSEIRAIAFDIIWIDVTFLCWRSVRPREDFERLRAKYRWVGEFDAFCIAGPQDDYDHTDNLDTWLVELGTDCILSWIPQRAEQFYPKAIAAGAAVMPSLTGFVDDDQIERYAALRRPFAQRTIDVGYRVRRPPPNFGRFGVLKSEFGRKFAAAANGRLITDISDDPDATLVGQAWPAFLGNCRYILGCEGGASIVDRTGELRDQVAAYIQAHPEADWEMIYRATGCARHEIGALSALTPRLFEIAMSGACPILVEGSYDGFVEPVRDYIPVKPDLSNIEDVIAGLGDWERAQCVAESAARTLLSNPRLLYRTWVRDIVAQAEMALANRMCRPHDHGRNRKLLAAHHRKALANSARRSGKLVCTLEAEIARLNSAYSGEIVGLGETVRILEAEIGRLNAVYSGEIARRGDTIRTLEAEIGRLNAVYSEEIARLGGTRAPQ